MTFLYCWNPTDEHVLCARSEQEARKITLDYGFPSDMPLTAYAPAGVAFVGWGAALSFALMLLVIALRWQPKVAGVPQP